VVVDWKGGALIGAPTRDAMEFHIDGVDYTPKAPDSLETGGAVSIEALATPGGVSFTEHPPAGIRSWI